MRCLKCHSTIRPGIKFCEECGSKLETTCPACKAKIPLGTKFCGECGSKLNLLSEAIQEDISFEEKLRKIQKYFPKGLTEKILSTKDKIEGERKQVTVIFCDMQGFTPLVNLIGAEKAFSIMDQVYELLIHKIHDYEGTVNEMTGDGIMALFGAPIALEDAPQRAIRSAYAIHRAVTKFNEKKQATGESFPPIKMRIGIHSGPVVIGSLGNDLRVEFKAVGDTVNIASRIESLAEPGTTYVSEDTFKLTEGFFRFEAIGPKKIKGKPEPIKIYRVIAPNTRKTRFDVSAERGLAPFVGRERELELLLDCLDRIKKGRGQVLSIVAEAGIGKSRLLYELRKIVSTEEITFLEGKCLSYSRGVAFHLLIDIMKANFDIKEIDGDSQIVEKVKKGLRILSIDRRFTLPFILDLLSVKDSDIDKITVSPESRKDQITEALKQIVIKGSELRPLILAFEDLHWIDESSEYVLKSILDSISGARVLMIFTYRPEFIHTWGFKSFHYQVTLNKLSNRESMILVKYLLGIKAVDRNLEDLILEKTEGVPFFIEEFIKSLIELRAIDRKGNKFYLAKDIHKVRLPSTIQDVIMARVDSLPEKTKEVIQIGSCIEREFSYELIKKVTNLTDKKLLSHLSNLKNSELLYERGVFPQSTCIFKHNLTREVIYDSILTTKREKLHELIGNAAENIYRNNIDGKYEFLSNHFIKSRNYIKGSDYSNLAGKKAEKSASLNDAIFHVKKRIYCLEKLPIDNDTQKKIIDSRATLGIYISQLNHPVEAKNAISPIIDLAIRNNYSRRLSQIYTIIGVYHLYVNEDFSNAIENLERAITISDKINAILTSVLARLWAGVVLSLNCEFNKASRHIKKAHDITVFAKNAWGISTMKSTLSYWIHNIQGKVDLGIETSDKAIRIAEESGGVFSRATAYLVHGISHLYRGFFDEAKEHLFKSLEFSKRINLIIWHALDHNQLGEIYYDVEQYKKSKDHYSQAIEILEKGKFSNSFINLNKIGLAKAKVMSNESDIDLASLYSCAKGNNLLVYDGWIKRNIGEILLYFDKQRAPEAEDWIQKAIKVHKSYGMQWNLGKDYKVYCELFKRIGDQARAKEKLQIAIEFFKNCNADGWVEKYQKELAEL